MVRAGGGLAVVSLLIVGGFALFFAPRTAPAWVAAALGTTAWPLLVAWDGARGTAMRGAIAWAALAVVAGLMTQGIAWHEPVAGGRTAAAFGAYVASLS